MVFRIPDGDTGRMENPLHPGSGAPLPLDVFIVEGSPYVRERLEEMVTSIAGARCTGSAASAEEAFGTIRRVRPDAVILDIGLEDGRGFELLRALRDLYADTSIYVLSNFVMEPYKRLAIRLGASAFFDKSTEIDAMRDLLAQRAAQISNLPH